MLSVSPELLDPRDLAECRALLRHGSKSFAAAARLLPADVRDHATALYAFCRVADDAVDEHHGGEVAVAELNRRLDAIYAGAPHAYATDRALTFVVAAHGLPRTLLDALIDGFAWDAAKRRYQTMQDLEDYAARVAGTVGAMMSVLMGARSPATIARACDLGVAMQLTNIARDVGEDARAGRLYLPLELLRAQGIDPEGWLADPQANVGVRNIVSALLQRAAQLYARARVGVGQLPAACRPGIHAARLIYADIARVVANTGYDSVSHRAVVPTRRKIWLLMKAQAVALVPTLRLAEGPIPSTRYLVEAVASSNDAFAQAHVNVRSRWWQVEARALWLIDLFERVERRERTGTTAALQRSAT